MAPGISRNNSLMATNVWGNPLDLRQLNKPMTPLENTENWIDNKDNNGAEGKNVSTDNSENKDNNKFIDV